MEPSGPKSSTSTGWQKERIYIELMTSDRQHEASSEVSKRMTYGQTFEVLSPSQNTFYRQAPPTSRGQILYEKNFNLKNFWQ